jgi:UDP-glucose 4-epimerase
MTRTVLVTGAHGFIGRYAARSAAHHGYRVVGMGHGAWLSDEWRVWGLSAWQEGDITIEGLRRCAEAPYAIVHAAGGASVPFSITHPQDDFQRTVQTSAAVVEYVRTQSPETRIVYCSSAGVYGLVGSVPIMETSPTSPISPYGVHKLMGEQLVRSYARHFGIRASIIRFFSVYGCGLRKQLLWDACGKFSLANPVFMGTGREVRDWVHVEDAADLILAGITNAAADPPVVNGGSNCGVTVADLLCQLSSHMSPEHERPRFSGISRTGDPTSLVADIEGATSWGWAPKHTWREGIAEYASWWIQEHKLSSDFRRNPSLLTVAQI